MSKITCLYGFKNSNIEAAREKLEKILCIKFAAHESYYHGGVYYLWDGEDEESLVLQRNIDLIDNEPEERDFPSMQTLLYVNNTKRSDDLKRILTSRIEDISLLREDNS